MPETTRVAALNQVNLDQLLLETKLASPLPRGGFVSRGALIAKGRRSGRRIVSVSAPSGYGKSILLSQWAAAEDRPVAWVSLDRFDDDPAALLFLLSSAFVRATGADSSLIDDMGGHGISALGRAAPRLATALHASPQPFVLMLDDLQELGSPGCHDVLEVVITGIPSGSQFVAASRIAQPHIPRLRAAGETIEFGVNDLALDADGARRIFAEADLDLASDDAETLALSTEGWPVGMSLAAVIARESTERTVTVAGNDRYVADYLYRESLAALSADTQSFLRRTAVLEQFCADLCDAVLDATGSQAILRHLEASNVFLIPLDRHRGWYRYHSLFGEFLQSELRQNEPELIAQLHLRAADWYEANASPGMAIEHLLDIRERDRCVRLVTENALPAYQAGQLETVQRWITTLGSDTVCDYPPLAVLAGWLAVMSGRSAAAEQWMHRIEQAVFDLPPADGTASFDSARAMLRSIMCAGGPEQAMADAALSLAQEPPWSVWRDQAVCLTGQAHLLTGDVERAGALFSEASELSTTTGNHDVHVLSDAERAVIAMDKGRWVEAARLSNEALAVIQEHRLMDYAISVIAFAGAARLALQRGDLTGATSELTKAMRSRQFCGYATPALAVRARLSLARTHFAMSDHATARHLLREIGDILMLRPALGRLVDDVSEFRAIIDSGGTLGTGAAPLTPAELRLLPYLQTHLSVPEIGARLYVSRNTVSTEVGSIYRKLGVSTRTGAVDRALAIGLLGA
ncbi:LuxR C-terminal-related transcriptional regulator [Cryobacterium sp. AP23]